MPPARPQISRVPLNLREHEALIRAFDCGAEWYAQEVATFLRDGGNPDSATDLYLNQAGKLVGFISTAIVPMTLNRDQMRRVGMQSPGSYRRTLDTLRVAYVGVDVSVQRQGIARAMFRDLLVGLGDGDPTWLSLLVWKANPLWGKYLDLGFRILSEQRPTYDGQPQTLLRMMMPRPVDAMDESPESADSLIEG